MSNLVLQCLSTLPMYTLFNLLGQGYKVVLAGRQFGGVVAHALAAKLLLQVQHEIQMARKMGLDLSALSRTGDKVRYGRYGGRCGLASRGLSQDADGVTYTAESRRSVE